MQVQFKQVRLVNFGSYHDATVNLQNQGFCLVTGQNNCKQDNAHSNGSGKSTIFSAICYALTGETLSGLSTNLKNLQVPDTDCFVELDLAVDSIDYKIIRVHKPKSDLKIFQNGTDISGKGITESTKKLKSVLPDLTKDLIASTILLGQGNAARFSSFSPSGRKQLLESLTHSDYQIEDIKNRLTDRLTDLSAQSRLYQDTVLVQQTTITSCTRQLDSLTAELSNQVKPDFEADIAALTAEQTAQQAALLAVQAQFTAADIEAKQLTQKLLLVQSEKADAQHKLLEQYSDTSRQDLTEQLSLENTIKNLTASIAAKKAVRDTCPTCGQKLANISKPDITQEEQELVNCRAQLAVVAQRTLDRKQKKQTYETKINDTYNQLLVELQSQAGAQTSLCAKAEADIKTINNSLLSISARLSQLRTMQANWDSQQAAKKAKVIALQKKLQEADTTLRSVKAADAIIAEHIAVVKKIDTIVKRDFRGYLLEDIVAYIDQRAKDYSEIVFGTRELNLTINSNNLDIVYCQKNFDNLSGGEKQRCDIILQLAIRDLLQTYMDYESNIIVLDEIFDALDATATSKIIELITTNLQSVESVFIISHHAQELGLSADVELSIVKNAAGISEIV